MQYHSEHATFFSEEFCWFKRQNIDVYYRPRVLKLHIRPFKWNFYSKWMMRMDPEATEMDYEKVNCIFLENMKMRFRCWHIFWWKTNIYYYDLDKPINHIGKIIYSIIFAISSTTHNNHSLYVLYSQKEDVGKWVLNSRRPYQSHFEFQHFNFILE